MPQSTDTYRVDAIRLGGWDWAPGFELFWMDFNAPDEPLALVGVVIRGGGVTALVNTGPDPAFVAKVAAEAAPGQQHVLRASADEHPEAALGRLGIGLADVTHVLVTPFQAYAIGNVLRFPNAEICLSRQGWVDFHAPRWRDHPHDKRALCIPDDVLVGLVTDAWPRVRLLDDEETLAPGLSVFWTGVHHRSSIAVKIATTQGAVIASDSFFRVENVTQNRPIGINESMEETLVAYARLRREADLLLPLYDPGVFERHPGGRVA